VQKPAIIQDSSFVSSDGAGSTTSDCETASTATPASPMPSAQPGPDCPSLAPAVMETPEAPKDQRVGRSSSPANQAECAVSTESNGRRWPRRLTSRQLTRSKSRREASEVEAMQIKQLMQLMDAGQPLGSLSEFAKEYGDEAFCRRLLRKYDGNIPKAAEKFKHALRWREQNRELIATRHCLHGSDERVVGADVEGHPILYTCLKNQMLPGSQCLDQKVVAMLQAIDNMPPSVETVAHIWDLHGMQFRISDLNPSPLIQMVQSLEGYFAERLQELIIIDMPRMALALKDAIWPLVPEKTKRKVRFVTSAQAKEYIQAKCDAEVASRIRAIMEQNRNPKISLEERKRSWMRVNERGELVPAFAQA